VASTLGLIAMVASIAGAGPAARAARAADLVSLTAVSCVTAGSCVAVGLIDSGQRELSFGARLRHGVWSDVRIPSPSQVTQLNSISCWSADGCEAVGAYSAGGNSGRALAERWDGRRWTVQATPAPPSTDAVRQLNAVSCVSAGACEAVGSNGEGTLVEAWDGHRWSLQSSPSRNSASQLSAVSCASADMCMAVGNEVGPLRTRSGPLIERWNGHRWTVEAAATPRGADNTDPLSVSCPSARVCRLVGYYNDSTEIGVPNVTELPLAEGFNGRRWTLDHVALPTGQSSTELTSVSCPRADRCLTLGAPGPGTHPSTVVGYRRNGGWELVASSARVSADNTESSQLSCPTTTTCVAVGGLSAVSFIGRRLVTRAVPAPSVHVGEGSREP